jgi:glycosyltransferase involved in cell wall biosynthesis
MKPNISIITICFNNPDDVRRTIESVDTQTLLPHEHYIIDGSENQKILHLLQNQSYIKSYRKSVHEPDNGISDAFNKGIHKANGNWIMMLNAGDRFYDNNSLEKIHNAIQNNPAALWMHGKYQLIRGGQKVIIGKTHEPSKVYRGMRSICHQSMVVHRTLYEKHGLYNIRQKFGMDYDFLLRIRNEPFYFLPEPVIDYDEKGISSTQYLASLKQTESIYQTYFGKSVKQQLWQWRLKILFHLLHSPIGRLLYKLKTSLKLENM